MTRTMTMIEEETYCIIRGGDEKKGYKLLLVFAWQERVHYTSIYVCMTFNPLFDIVAHYYVRQSGHYLRC